MREDTIFGMAASQAIAYFLFVAAGAVRLPSGLRQIETASQAAMALHPIARGAAEALFANGMIGTGLLAVPTLTGSSAYAIAAAAKWPAGIDKPAWQTKGFNVTIVIGMLIAGGIARCGYNARRLFVARQATESVRAAFPDVHFTVQDEFAEDD